MVCIFRRLPAISMQAGRICVFKKNEEKGGGEIGGEKGKHRMQGWGGRRDRERVRKGEGIREEQREER